MEKMIQIPEWQFKHIENALRLTHRINKCANKETAFDREVVKAYGFATEALANVPTSENSLHKHVVINPVCPLCHGKGEYNFGGSFGGAVQTVRCPCRANGL